MKWSSILPDFMPTVRCGFLVGILALIAGAAIGQEAKWPPLGPELIERIENLPRERAVVLEKASEIGAQGTATSGDVHLIEHWKPLLIVLIGRAEKLTKSDAERRYEEIMKVIGLLTQAEFESRHGELTAAGRYFAIPLALSTEHLLAHYTRLVMFPDHWDVEEWLEWQGQWTGAVAAEEPSPEPETDLPASGDPERIALLGDWVAPAGSDSFATAHITPRKILLVWQEAQEGPVQRISLPIERVEEGRIYSSPDDVGLVYLLSEDEEGREALSFELRSEDPALVKFELDLVREEE